MYYCYIINNIKESPTHFLFFLKMCFVQFFFSIQGIINHDRWWTYAIGSLRSPGCLPDWQPSNHLNAIKGLKSNRQMLIGIII
jgi:hypothetical protein